MVPRASQLLGGSLYIPIEAWGGISPNGRGCFSIYDKEKPFNSPTNAKKFAFLRPGAELNRRIEILQISALPLGYHADHLF